MGEYVTLMMDAEKAKIITGINTGACDRRLQEGQPAFFVGWIQDGEARRFFSSQRFMIELAERNL